MTKYDEVCKSAEPDGGGMFTLVPILPRSSAGPQCEVAALLLLFPMCPEGGLYTPISC